MILQLASKHAIPFLMMALLFVFNTLIGGVQTTLRADLKTKSTLERVDSTQRGIEDLVMDSGM